MWDLIIIYGKSESELLFAGGLKWENGLLFAYR